MGLWGVLGACGSEDPAPGEPGGSEEAGGQPDLIDAEAAKDLLAIEPQRLPPGRLGPGFAKKGIPFAARVGPRGAALKAKVVVDAHTAQRLGLWPDPDKLKMRSVAQANAAVEPGQSVRLTLRPHAHYAENFRDAHPDDLRRARYHQRGVLKDAEGREFLRVRQPIAVR